MILDELSKKQKELVAFQKELKELANEKSKEIYEIINERLTTYFDPAMFEIMVPLTGGIFSETWKPTIGFGRIGTLDFHQFYELTKKELVEYNSEVIDWSLFYQVCDQLSKELEIDINITRR